MMSLPFLIPAHRLPLTSFDSEWLAMLLGLLCAGAMLLGGRGARLAIPPVALAPALLGGVVLLQAAFAIPAYAGNALVFSSYLAWSALLAVAGRQCAAGLGAAPLYRFLAWFVLGGGALSALAGLIQYAGLAPAVGTLVAAPSPVPGEGVYANLAQQNHYATHVALALASALYLYGEGQLRRAPLAASVLLLATGLALSGSRSTLLYTGWLALAYVLFRRGRLPWRALAWVALAAGLLVGGLLVAAHYCLLGPRLARMAAFGQGIGPRSFLWQHAWQMFLGHPLLGVGVDRFAEHLVAQLRPDQYNWGIDQYAHNLVLQVLALTGIAGACALLAPLAAFARRVLRERLAPQWLWAGSVLGILFIHSMLEQPLHYAYFLGMAAFVAGSIDPGGWTLALAPWRRRAGLAAVALALLGMGATWRSFDILSDHFYGPDAGDPYDERHHALILGLHGHPLFTPLAELISPASFVPAGAPAADKLAFNTRLAGFAPTAAVLFRQSSLLAEAGRTQDAIVQFERAALAYPAEVDAYLGRFAGLSAQDPRRYGALWRFAQQYAATTKPMARP